MLCLQTGRESGTGAFLQKSVSQFRAVWY